MISSELSALAMIRWHEGFHAGGGGFTGAILGVVAVGLLLWGFSRERKAA
jgi:multisubunit Na+/H+ antiporter MnhB subunit